MQAEVLITDVTTGTGVTTGTTGTGITTVMIGTGTITGTTGTGMIAVTTGRTVALTKHRATVVTGASRSNQIVTMITVAVGAGVIISNHHNQAVMITGAVAATGITAGETIIHKLPKTVVLAAGRNARHGYNISSSIYIIKAIPVIGMAFAFL
ncbi:hypothetical protein E2R65_12470 [Mucilaginibacter phyllosphaerae]|uniref:Uncharacterized protein n=1 Tax=Mucilaginibacter phyllosphaerae TaxID=1812349 RepID=A0A4Y8ABN5_9SPHI|nr:hypothetical protein E2R65_12470 [Mucilaginibacter phyllosphaerae]